MNAAFQATLRLAEGECAREPIRTPGAVQTAGLLYVLDAATGAVLGHGAGAPPLAASVAATVGPAMEGAGANATGWGDVATADGRLWSASLHRVGTDTDAGTGTGMIVLELEHPEAPEAASRALDHLGLTIDALAASPDIAAAAEVAASQLRAMTGFDRVMVYRFAPDWSGEVVGESLASGPGIDSFAGLRFPASDIPPQARALYQANRVRLIADATSRPVPLVGVAPDFDLSQAVLRAVSPVHLAYLANMGVRASMSVAITHGNALWGLLACHHVSGPLAPGHRTRQAAETVGRALAWRLAELESGEIAAAGASIVDLAAGLGRALAAPPTEIAAALEPFAAPLLAAAGGVAFLLAEGDAVLFGAGDEATLPPGLVGALTEAAATTDTFETDRAGDGALGLPGEALAAAGFFGVLARRIVAGGETAPDTWALWLKREFRHEVVWAGNPEKQLGPHAAPGALPVLTPRRSFAAWREQVRGRAAPFTAGCRRAADLVRAGLQEALLRRAQAVAAGMEELRRRNEAIRFFADAAVHDLREPLWQIQVFAGALRDELPAEAEGGELAGVIESSAGRMRAMLDELADYATAGVATASVEGVSLDDIAREAAADLGRKLQAAGGTIGIALDALGPVACDAAKLRRVFQNLFSNAIKYRRSEAPLRITVSGEREGGTVRCEVADNGHGFDEADAERIFEPFLRLDQSGATPAEGLGLGLAICRRVLEGHGGTIEAHGARGQGARFVFTLPAGGDGA